MTLREAGFEPIEPGDHAWLDEERAATYLESAPVLAVSPQVAGAAALALHTDGVWVWPSTLADAVRAWHCALPDDLVARMREHGFRVPAVDITTIDPGDVGLVPLDDTLP